MTLGHENERAGIEALLFVMLSLIVGAFCRVGLRYLPIDIPYTVVLFCIGFGWGFIPDDNNDAGGGLGGSAEMIKGVGPRFFLNVFLPALIFYAAFEMKWYVFRQSLWQILLLAVPGVFISASLTALVGKFVLVEESPGTFATWEACFILGAILSATDPVAVVALMRKSGAPVQVITVMEGESLLNDAVAMICFDVVFTFLKGDTDAGPIVEQIVTLSLGAVALGLLWAMVVIWVLGHIRSDAMVEISVCFVSAYLLFYVAEFECGASGIMAVVMYGICFPWFGKTRFSPGSGRVMEKFLEIICYMSETVMFMLAGVLVSKTAMLDQGGDRFTGKKIGFAILLWLLINIIRFIMLAVLSPLMTRVGSGFSKGVATVYGWGGIRGAVSLALALDLAIEMDDVNEARGANDTRAIDQQHLGRDILIYVAFVTFLTLVINAPLTGPLLSWIARKRVEQEVYAEKVQLRKGVTAMSERTKLRIKDLQRLEECYRVNWTRVEEYVNKTVRIDKLMAADDSVALQDETLLLKEARMLFLRAVKEDYKTQVNAGALRWSAATTLTLLADTAVDVLCQPNTADVLADDTTKERQPSRRQTPDLGKSAISQLNDVKGASLSLTMNVVQLLQQPSYLRWMKKYLSKGIFGYFVDRLITNGLRDTVNALDGLRHAYTIGVNVISQECAQREADIVVSEAKECWNEAQRMLDEIEKKYPDELCEIRSNSAAMRLLASQLDDLESKSTAFTVEAKEAIRNNIAYKQHKLIHNRKSFDVQTDLELNAMIPLRDDERLTRRFTDQVVQRRNIGGVHYMTNERFTARASNEHDTDEPVAVVGHSVV
eukprot:m.93467 g.93467  ORF g.93467 m.93467 type:complete len:830 (+) comp26639_c0_seq2:203-2692(+)